MKPNFSNQTAQLYDRIAGDYDRHMATTGHYEAQKQLFVRLKKYFQSPVLDLAAGPGFIVKIFLENNLRVIANDLSATMVYMLREKFEENPNVSIIQNDAHAIVVPELVSTVFCSNLLYYLDDRSTVIQQWITHLQGGGHIVVFEEHPFQRSVTGPMSRHEDSLEEIVKPISPADIEALFQSAGLVAVASEHISIDDEHDLYGFVFKKR